MREILAVSMIQLLANGDRFAGKRITVTGVIALEFEHQAVYASFFDRDNRMLNSGVWLDFKGDSKINRRQIKKGLFLISGVYDSKDLGHKGMFSGTITVEKISEWLP